MDLKFRFDPSDHSYYLGDRRLIGVSEAIQTAGLKDFSRIDPTVLERAEQRGTAVHAACHYLDDGDLNWATVSPEIEPYVRAWERFKKETGVELLEIEKPRYHATLGFAGTPDSVVNLYPHKGIIDLKTYPRCGHGDSVGRVFLFGIGSTVAVGCSTTLGPVVEGRREIPNFLRRPGGRGRIPSVPHNMQVQNG
jgi:hypothetical protein